MHIKGGMMIYHGYTFERTDRKLYPIAYKLSPYATFDVQLTMLQHEMEQALEDGDVEYANAIREVLEYDQK